MKKIIMSIVLMILILPVLVNAEECKPDSIKIKSIELNSKSEDAQEINSPTFDNNNLNFDLKMYDLNDYVEYKIVVKNTSDEKLIFDANSLNKDSDYIEYQAIYKDDSKEINPNEEKEILIRVSYKKEVSSDKFRNGKYIVSDSVMLDANEAPSIIDIITNPETKRNITLFIIFTIVLFSGLPLFRKNKSVKPLLLLLAVFPLGVLALCSCGIEMQSNVIIEKAKPNPCTYDGELVQGAEFTSGQYTYRYKQENNSNNWSNITDDGWGVRLTDKNSEEDVTSKLCTSINDKPIVSMKSMFYGTKTHNIDTSSFDTSHVKNMNSMFYDSPNIEKLDLSSFDTTNVTNMYSMFAYNYKLEEINVKGFNTEHVSDMNYMFYDCNSIKELDLSSFNTDNNSNLYYLFYNNTALKKLNIDNFNFTNSGVDLGLLYNTTSLKELSMKNCIFPQNIENLINGKWYGNNSPIETIDVTGCDISNTTNLQKVFANCSNLETIIGLDTWDTSKVTDMEQMFLNCEKIKKLDLSNFDLTNVIYTYQMLENMKALEEIITPKKYFDSNNKKIDLPNIYVDSEGILYNDLKTGNKTKEKIILKPIAIFDTGSNVNNKFKKLANNSQNNIVEIKRTNTAPNINEMTADNDVSANISSFPIYAWFDNGTIYYYCESSKIYMNNNASYMFNYFQNVQSIDFTNVDTSLTTDMGSMFNRAGYNATEFSIDLSSWDTSNVTNMSSMFSYAATNSETIIIKGLSNWNTSNVTSMSSIFSYLGEQSPGDIKLNIQNWKINPNASVGYIFAGLGRTAKSVKLDLSNWDLSELKSAKYMFYNYAMSCHDAQLIVDDWDTSGVEDMSYMFEYALYYSENVNLDLSSWDTRKVTNMSYMFHNVGNMSKQSVILDLTNWNTANVTNMQNMFWMTGAYAGETTSTYSNSKVIYRGLNAWNVEKVTDMSSMFSGSGKYAETVIVGDLSNWHINNATNLYRMFYEIGYRASNVNDIGTLNIYSSNIGSMFNYSGNIKATLNLNKAITSYGGVFSVAATLPNSGITVNYSNEVTNIDDIINTKSANSNVIKGEII